MYAGLRLGICCRKNIQKRQASLKTRRSRQWRSISMLSICYCSSHLRCFP